MKIDLSLGRYVAAVSGGVDSMVLLSLLKDAPDTELIVAHFDHGIRPDSAEDRKLAEKTAQKYNLQFVYGEGKLGANASEEKARQARYDFLNKVKEDNQAQAIITAHHQDDVLETAIINLLRGTGRKGLTSLMSRPGLLRPLLNVPKQEIRAYAHNHDIQWREDSTNQDPKHLRNYVRHKIIPRMGRAGRQQFLNLLKDQQTVNRQLDSLLAECLDSLSLDRRFFACLPHDVAREILAMWLRNQGVRDFDSKTLERVVVALKVGSLGAEADVIKNTYIIVGREKLALHHRER